jgi:predicted DNA-binding WGR domain protein
VIADRAPGELVARALVSGLVLELVDLPPGRGRRCRYYALHVQPTLFDGGIDVVRTWGRIGSIHRPRRLCTHHLDEPAAFAALERVLHRRLRRGYRC